MPPTLEHRVDAAIGAAEVLVLARRLVAIPSYGPDHGWEAGVASALSNEKAGRSHTQKNFAFSLAIAL